MAQNWLKQLQAANAQNAINAQSDYNQLDTDGDGKLTAKELAQVCELTILEAEELIEQYDANGDGTLDQNEFEDLKQQILQQKSQLIKNEINANTNYTDLDVNNDGKLSANELANACNITVEQAQDVIIQYDANGDGMLDANEFEDLKQQILQQQRADITNNINANDTYNQFDANGDGKLDYKELAIACNISEPEAYNVILQYDGNGDGMLDENEFEDLKQQILQQQTANMTGNINENDTYDQLDANGDGQVDYKELAIACNISEQEAQNIIYQYDANGDGTLDKNEFEELKKQIFEQQNQINNDNVSNTEQKETEETYVTASGTQINEDVAAYQSAVYDNNQPQMVINNSIGRDKTNSTFVAYNENDNAPVFSGNINKVNTAEYDPNNSNAKAFGVDIFENDDHKKQQYNAPQNNHNNNSSPFGKVTGNNTYSNTSNENNNVNNSPFGKATGDNNSPFGKAPQNNSPFGKPPGGYDNKPKPIAIIPTAAKPKFAHQWALGIKFDVKNEQIILNVSDDTTHKKWRKIVSKQDHSGDMKQEYFRLGGIVSHGDAKYTYPAKGVGSVQVSLSKDNDTYNFYAQPIM